VPKNRGSFEVAYANPRYVNVAVSVYAVGLQYDDPENIRTVPGYAYPGLPKFATVGLSASRQLGRNLEAFFGVQNLFDQTYYVGTLPTTVGTPRFVTGGIRVSLSGR
jgi:outer membrane receptor protein involved in Fe transport